MQEWCHRWTGPVICQWYGTDGGDGAVTAETARCGWQYRLRLDLLDQHDQPSEFAASTAANSAALLPPLHQLHPRIDDGERAARLYAINPDWPNWSERGMIS